MRETIGEQISPILVDVEDALWQHEFSNGSKPNYTIEGFKGATKIFMSVIMDKIWDLQESEQITMDDREKMAEKCGQDIRNLIKTYTNIDTFDLYKDL